MWRTQSGHLATRKTMVPVQLSMETQGADAKCDHADGGKPACQHRRIVGAAVTLSLLLVLSLAGAVVLLWQPLAAAEDDDGSRETSPPSSAKRPGDASMPHPAAEEATAPSPPPPKLPWPSPPPRCPPPPSPSPFTPPLPPAMPPFSPHFSSTETTINIVDQEALHRLAETRSSAKAIADSVHASFCIAR